MRSILFGLIVLCVTFFASCSKDDDSSSSDPTTITNQISNSGNWRVALFSEDGVDETSYFNGYTFAFNSGSSVIATKSGSSITGSWVVIQDSGKNKLVLAFPDQGKFEEISEDWEILTQTDNNINLRHVSGGNGGTDLLNFVK
ncbi:MAG TPA: hypothetical protein VK169_07000 [Saprospiraceae bacterium]|nr:hypothetical protein [Saprospiraceae bacterium]